MSLIAELAPLAGRLAFAAVFVALVIWLLMMPKRLLGDDDEESSDRRSLWLQARTWAVVIASVQIVVYLFWR